MPSKNKLFLELLAEAWSERFPFLIRTDIDEIPKRVKGGNYICETYYVERGVYYFISIEFHKKRKGEFTIDVTISDSKLNSIRDGKYWDPSSFNPCVTGAYRLGMFVNRRDYWWALEDFDAIYAKNIKSLGFDLELVKKMTVPPNNRWQPSCFSKPFEEIAREAIADINNKLEEFVFPKLKLFNQPQKLS